MLNKNNVIHISMNPENLKAANQLTEEWQKYKRLLNDLDIGGSLRSITFAPYIGRQVMIDENEMTTEISEQIKEVMINHLKNKILLLEELIANL